MVSLFSTVLYCRMAELLLTTVDQSIQCVCMSVYLTKHLNKMTFKVDMLNLGHIQKYRSWVTVYSHIKKRSFLAVDQGSDSQVDTQKAGQFFGG